MTDRLWLIGGTQESRQLVARLLTHCPADQIGLLVTVTTAAARSLYPDLPPAAVWVGQLQPDQGHDFVRHHGIGAILDVSHPFATAISQLAIALAQHHQLPYLRYERPAMTVPDPGWRDRCDRPGYLCVPTLATVLAESYLVGERTLLTLGYRSLAAFAPWQTQGTLFARILPSPTALAAALAAGFTPDRIIALRPPISPELERALWQQWQLTQVITKASGRPGGEAQKQAIAATLGVRLLQIMRPLLAYPHHTESLDTALAFALRYCG